MTFTDRAIVLGRTSWREADKRVILYTRAHGKIEAVAVGARKIKSKLSGHLEPLREIDVMIARGVAVNKLAQATTRAVFLGDNAPRRLTMLGGLIGLVERATEVEVVDFDLFELLRVGLNRLASALEINLAVGYSIALQSIATHLGYAPEFGRCVVCGNADAISLKNFSVELGGVVCSDCNAFNTVVFNPDLSQRYFYILSALRWQGL